MADDSYLLGDDSSFLLLGDGVGHLLLGGPEIPPPPPPPPPPPLPPPPPVLPETSDTAGCIDVVLEFIDTSPPGLFPENADSYFGSVIRNPFTSRICELISQQNSNFNNRFVDTADARLEDWEIETGVPVAPTGMSEPDRRTIIEGAIRKGPFTRARRRQVVEKYLTATFGTPMTLGVDGAALTSAGIPLYSGEADVTTLYEIVEDIPAFTFHIFILDTITVSAGMVRELEKVVPAGIAYDITYVSTLP